MANHNELTITYKPAGRNGSAVLTASLAGDVLYIDKLDLTKPKARVAFTNALCDDRPGIDSQIVAEELLRIAASLTTDARLRDDKDTDTTDPEALLARMPEDVRAEARAMLEDAELFKRVVKDVELLGVAGERELVATIYLVGVSRLLPKPLAGIVQGPSSTGKSYVIEQVSGLFPPEAVVQATQMTPQALFHMKPGSLMHRFVVAGERSRLENDETAETSRALREMLSAGRLTKLMPIRVDGEIQTASIHQDGPISYMESTTLGKIFDEDANRCILLTTDERQQQTRRILTSLAETYGGAAPAVRAERAIQRHHALQRMLQAYLVVVPFAERLGELISHDRVQVRRAFPQLMSMIQASALLHQQQRQVDTDGRLLAAADDYQVARHLLAMPLARSLGGVISEPAKRFYGRLRERITLADQFTARDAAKEDEGGQRSVYGWLGELHDAGFFDQVERARGNQPARWQLAADPPDHSKASALPSVEKVFRD